MIFVSSLTKIAKLGIASSFVKNDEPVSIILLGKPETGKSSIIMRFNPPKGVYLFTDITKSKLEAFLKDMQNTRYILIPDFIKVISRGKAAKGNILSLLNAGLEEGILEVTQYAAGIPQTTPMKKPIRFGMMTAMTRSVIQDRRREWHRIGFFSRMLPVSFSYTSEQARQIREYICAGKEIFAEKEKVRLSPKSIHCSKKHVMKFEPFVKDFAEAQHLYGFRMTKQFRSLLKASALLRSSKKVTNRDVKEVTRLSKWFNLDYNTTE